MLDISNQNQYNQGISRYKLLSTNAGVGAIVTSEAGTYVLISDINKWNFISAANVRISDIRNNPARSAENWYDDAERELYGNLGIELVKDLRFIEFLKLDKGLTDLLCLAAIPHLSLNESTNRINLANNPTIKRLKDRGIDKKEEDLTVPGTHFPKWFRNDAGEFKPIKAWREQWRKAGLQSWLFAPPRDSKNKRELTQTNLTLICENGHLSDIPWERYLRWCSQPGGGNGDGSDIFYNMDRCCDRPALKWSESKNRSEGYGSIFLECTNCGMGSGKPGQPKVNLQGINNLHPYCPGHKPWEMSLDDGTDDTPYDQGCSRPSGERTTMQVALATGNNIYFANTFSSVYVPQELVTGISDDLDRVLKVFEARYASVKRADKTRADWAKRKIDAEELNVLGIDQPDMDELVERTRSIFIAGPVRQILADTDDLHERYREQEYKVFTQNSTGKDGLIFHDIRLSPRLATYFTRIKRIDELKVTSVQLDLTRVRPKERLRGPDGKIIQEYGKNVFSVPVSEVFILPAIENRGEGIFFQFSEDRIARWMDRYNARLTDRIAKLLPIPGNFNGKSLRQKIARGGPKFLLIHTFSHLIMRELEFTCGYPTASLKERLYISPNMEGVMIFTAEGSEGSMGGLIWQAEAARMEELLVNALERALDCSADPLCWEIDSQGVFNLNLAACFSCALVAETACEERNLGLDRKLLIDAELGFFKEI
ncbi:MAG TPA: DUF1998 domain-containing protein [Puia sp.]|jgi:hypothetical protein|nr:DUF1998 domain-containing protein [Puia sp.]